MAGGRTGGLQQVREDKLVCSRTSYACGLTAVSADEADAEAFIDEVAKDAAAIKAGFALIFFRNNSWTHPRLPPR
jgi:hypothetical protein